MAKAKKAAKKKSVSKRKGANNSVPALPTGYRVIGRAASWDFERHPVINGVRGPIKEFAVKRGTKDEYDTRTMIVNDEEIGAVTVWESTDLADFFDQTEDGDIVRIEYLGEVPAKKKGQKPLRQFQCSVKE